MRDFVVRTAVL